MRLVGICKIIFAFCLIFVLSSESLRAATCTPIDWLKPPMGVATFYYKNDQAYDKLVLTFKGGNAPWSAKVVSGSLPPGMSLKVVPFTGGWAADGSNGDIHVTGQPTVEGDYFPVIQLADSCPNGVQAKTYRIQLQVRCGEFKYPYPAGMTLPPAVMGKPYSFQFKTSCDSRYENYGFSAYVGTEPPGLKLSDTGLLSGIPVRVENKVLPYNYNVKVIATLYGGNPPKTCSQTFSLQVIDNVPPSLTYFGVTKNVLGAGGGSTDVIVKASDNDMMYWPKITVTYPDGKQYTYQAVLKSGSYSSGEFQAAIPLPANNTRADAVYKLSGLLIDKSGNKTTTQARTVKVSSIVSRVAPTTIQPGIQVPAQRLPVR